MTVSVQDLSPRQLQYVVAVAETLGFHKAAERCHVSQPTLSAQVKQLEDVLGVQLFERDRRRVLLTAAGADLREGRLDAGLLALEADIGEWASGRIADDPFVVALPEGHRLARKKRVAASDLDNENVLLLDEGHCFRAQALSICSRAGAKESTLRATSLSTLAQMVSSGSGITLLPQIAVPVENRRGQLAIRPFTSPAPHRTIALIWRPQSPFAATFRDLADVFRTALRRSG